MNIPVMVPLNISLNIPLNVPLSIIPSMSLVSYYLPRHFSHKYCAPDLSQCQGRFYLRHKYYCLNFYVL